MDISVSKLKQDNLDEYLKFTFHANQSNFKKKFEEQGILVEGEKDLVFLKNATKVPVLQIVKTIRISEQDLKQNINFVE